MLLFFWGGGWGWGGGQINIHKYIQKQRKKRVNLIYLDNANVTDELIHVECSYFRNSDAVNVINNIYSKYNERKTRVE